MELEERVVMENILTLKFLIALGNSRPLRKEIDKEYSKNKLEYYEAAKKAEIHKNSIIYTYPSAVTESITKLAGIYFWCMAQNNFASMEKFIKIGFKNVYDYFKKNDVIDLHKFVPSIFKNLKDVVKYTEQELADLHSVLYWLCLGFLKPCELGICEDDVRASIDRIYFGNIGHNREILKIITKKYQQNINNLHSVYGLNLKKSNNRKSLDMLFYDITILEEFNIDGITPAILRNYDKLRPLLGKQSISKYTFMFTRIFNLLGIDSCTFEQSELTTEEFNQIFALYFLSKDEYALPDSERDLFLIALIYIKALIKEYQDTRLVYLANAREENYLDTLMLKKEIDEKLRLLRKEGARYNTENDQLKAKVDQLQTEMSRYERELTRMKRDMEQVESNKKELIALREFMFDQSNEATQDTDIEPDEYAKTLEILNNKACAIIGGHPNWVRKVKEILPNYSYVDVESLNRGLKYLDKKEIVFVNTDYNSHSLYHKVVAQLEKSETKLHLIRGTSVQNTISAMGKALENNIRY